VNNELMIEKADQLASLAGESLQPRKNVPTIAAK
jgi:hypothetical protein